jgi:ferredoxin
MRLQIEDFCIRCQICVSLYPELFEYDLENDIILTRAEEVTEDLMAAAKGAARDCAVTAIFLKKPKAA